MVVADDGLEARADPLDGFSEHLGRVHQRAILRIRLRADAEAAADVARMQADALGGRAGNRGEVRQHHRHALRARVHVVRIGRRVVDRDAGLRLHRIARHTRAVEREPGNVRGLGKGLGGRLFIAVDVVEGQVARHALVQ